MKKKSTEESLVEVMDQLVKVVEQQQQAIDRLIVTPRTVWYYPYAGTQPVYYPPPYPTYATTTTSDYQTIAFVPNS